MRTFNIFFQICFPMQGTHPNEESRGEFPALPGAFNSLLGFVGSFFSGNNNFLNAPPLCPLLYFLSFNISRKFILIFNDIISYLLHRLRLVV